MTRVCLVGDPEVNLRYELLSRETSRRALQTYDLRAPFENTVGLETVSLGGAVSLLNDLNWYIVRFVDEALVLEPSVSDREWLSRDLATAVRDDRIDPAETDRHLKVYGVEGPGSEPETLRDDGGAESDEPGAGDAETAPEGAGSDPASPEAQGSRPAGGGSHDVGGQLPRLVEPMLVTRTGDTIPEYDLRDVEDTLVVRLTELEFENQ